MAARINEKFQGVSARREPAVALQSGQTEAPSKRTSSGIPSSAWARDGFEGLTSAPRASLPSPSSLPALPSTSPAAGAPISQSVTPKAPIEDNKTVTSTLSLTGDATVDSLKLNLDIAHS